MRRSDMLRKLRTVLVRRRDALKRAREGDFSLLNDARGNDLSDLVDFASDSAQYEMNLQVLERQTHELEQIDSALERMDDGRYGVCEITGQPIPLPRLQALPYTTICIEAQRLLERRGYRSGLHSSDDPIDEADLENIREQLEEERQDQTADI